MSMYLPKFNVPKSVHVELTDKCNAQCPVCVRRFNGGEINPIIKNIELNVDYFKNQLGKEFCSQVMHWDFCGTKGDPISCTDLYEIMEYLTECQPFTYYSIHTNGGYKSEKWWSKLGEFFKDSNSHVMWGIDGLEDTNHIYRKNVKWNKVWNNLKAYNKAGGPSVWQFLEFDHNKHQIPEIQKICKDMGIRLDIKDPFGFNYRTEPGDTHISVTPIEVYDNKGELSYSILPKDATQEQIKIVPVDEYGRMLRRTGTKILADLDGNYDIDCRVGLHTSDLYIDCTGAFLPCCFIGAGMHVNGVDPQLKEQLKDIDSLIPSENNPPKKIFASKYFAETLPKGIKGELSDDKKYTVQCVETCGKCLE